MDKIKTCANKCIFCFIDQLPDNLRPTLYIKDDDYIESYTSGNFITLTNLTGKDIEKIIRFRIEPLHVSIHSFDHSVREIMFGNSKSISALDAFYKLDKNEIRTNIQIVLCPGINDGTDLENTLTILISEFKNILSIGIVPVGITSFNRNRLLKSFDRDLSKKLIDFTDDFRNANKNNRNSKKIFLSDEFYIMAGRDFPEYKYYGRFLQIQNGIGKTADFINDFNKEAMKANNTEAGIYSIMAKKNDGKKTLILTSEYGKHVLKMVFSFHKNKAGLLNKIRIPDIIAVKNNFFGGNVKITGLLSGKDIIKKIYLLDIEKYKSILIPEIIFNKDGLTIDDLRIEDLKKASPLIIAVRDSGKELYSTLREKI